MSPLTARFPPAYFVLSILIQMGLPMPLRFSLKPDRILYTQVMDQVRAAVAAGSLTPGEALPPFATWPGSSA